MHLTFISYELKFKRPFSIAHSTRSSTPAMFTKVEHDEFFGYGEACMPPYLGETHRTATEFLLRAQKILSGFTNPSEMESILRAIDQIAQGNNAAKASVDIALHDLLGKMRNLPCWKMFGLDKTKTPFTTFTIPMDDEEGIRIRIEEANEYKILKVKLGSDRDKKIIEAVRSFSDKPIATDVNEGWKDKFYALEMLHWLKEKNTLFVEQPMPKEKSDDMAWLTERSPLPIIADEAVKRFSDLKDAKGVYSGINVKLMKSTGLLEARKMIQEAKKSGMKILLGCMSESSCAVSAGAQLAPLADWTDLDGPLLIENDCFEGIKFIGGKIFPSDLPGTGAVPLPNNPFLLA